MPLQAFRTPPPLLLLIAISFPVLLAFAVAVRQLPLPLFLFFVDLVEQQGLFGQLGIVFPQGLLKLFDLVNGQLTPMLRLS